MSEFSSTSPAELEPSTDRVRELLAAGETEMAAAMIEELYAGIVPTDEEYAALDEEIL